MASSDQLHTTTILPLVLGAFILIPMLMMGFGGMMGYGGMMGQYGSTGGWWPFIGMVVPLVFFLVLLGGGYLIIRRVTDTQSSHNPAIEELRLAYARGDPTDEEFEARREKLEQSE
jgi:putative membrane protein